jgi:hypothetical protein
LNDPKGCIFTQNLLVEDVTRDEITAAVGGSNIVGAPVVATGGSSNTNGSPPVVAGSGVAAAPANPTSSSDTTRVDAPATGISGAANVSSSFSADFSAGVSAGISAGATPASDNGVAPDAITPANAIGAPYTGTGAAQFVGDSYVSNPPIDATGYSGAAPAAAPHGDSNECLAPDSKPSTDLGITDAPISAPGSQYVSPDIAAAALAISLAAEIAVPSAVPSASASSSAVNMPTPTPTPTASPSLTPISQPSQATVTAPVGLDFGSCPNAGIVFGPGFDGRKEDSFQPADKTQFQHGSAQSESYFDVQV